MRRNDAIGQWYRRYACVDDATECGRVEPACDKAERGLRVARRIGARQCKKWRPTRSQLWSIWRGGSVCYARPMTPSASVWRMDRDGLCLQLKARKRGRHHSTGSSGNALAPEEGRGRCGASLIHAGGYLPYAVGARTVCHRRSARSRDPERHLVRIRCCTNATSARFSFSLNTLRRVLAVWAEPDLTPGNDGAAASHVRQGQVVAAGNATAARREVG